MKSIKIYIFDSAKVNENESLGFEKNGKCVQLVDFHFDETQLSGYWIDPDIDDDTNTQDINFYIAGQSFKTPYSNASELILRSCLNIGL
jgi:hypothetical protein